MSHPKNNYFKPPPDVNLANYDLSKSSSAIAVKLKYSEISSGKSVSDLVTPISPRKAHILNFPDIAFSSEVLVGEEVSIKAIAPYPVNFLVKVLHGEVKLCPHLRQNPDIEIFISNEIVPICFLTEILTIESISTYALLAITSFLDFPNSSYPSLGSVYIARF